MLDNGTQIGRYKVLDLLGEGSMGEVYRAWDGALDRVVALKLLLPLRAESEQAQKRFAREARLAARINHPAVAHVYDIGAYDGSPFIAMEFVPGRQLRQEMGGPLPVERVLFLIRQILEGLEEAHRRGVVHRDLKPENILISGRDQVKILDFGLAKAISEDASGASENLTNTGITGTPRYMAPEQIKGDGIDVRTDLYTLGTILYEMLSGKPAHQGKTLGDLLMAVVHRPCPDLPEGLAAPSLQKAVKTALMKNPVERFQSVKEMLNALEGAPAVATPPESGQHEHIPHPKAAVYTARGREALTGLGTSSSVAIDLLAEAVQLDPDYALAHAMYAEACAALFNTGHMSASWLDKAQSALDRAERLDPLLPDLRVARARMLWTKTFNFPAETALRELRLALHADPDHAGALRLWATVASHIGLFESAEAAIARRMSSDEDDDFMVLISASLFLSEIRPERALDTIKRKIDLDPNHEEPLLWGICALSELYAGRIEDAKAHANKTLRRHPSDPVCMSVTALVDALQGRPEEVRAKAEAAEHCMKSELHPHHAFHLLASAESVLGNVDRALYWLRRTADEGLPCYPWFLEDPFLANLRSDPQGQTFLADLARRFEYFRREFPLNDPVTLSFIATEVNDGS